MAGEKQSMSQLADEYFGDISMFKVQSESSTENAGERVEKKELLETSIDEALDESTVKEDVSSRPIQADNNGDIGLPARDVGENVEQEDSGRGREYKGRSVETSLYHDACFLSEDESEGKTGESEDKEMDEVKLDSPVPSEIYEIKKDEEGAVDEKEEPGNSRLPDGKPEDMDYHGERRRSSFGYFDGSFEDLSIMVFPEEAPRRRKSSLGNTIIIVPNEPKLPEGDFDADGGETGGMGDKREDGNAESIRGYGSDRCHVTVPVGEDGENVNEMGDGEDKDRNEGGVGDGFAMRDVAVQVDESGESGMQDGNGHEGDNADNSGSGGIRNVAVQVGGDEENINENGEENELENIPEDEGAHEDETWTLLEAWTGFASMFGAMPYRIERKHGLSEIRASGFSKAKWVCTTVLSAIKTANVIPKTMSIFNGKDNPLVFLKLGGNFVQVFMYVLFWRAVMSKQKYLTLANNRILSSSYNRCKMSKLMTGLLIFAMMIIAFANTSLYIVYRTKFYNTGVFYSIQAKDIAEMLECHGQEALTWNNGNCIPAEFLSASNVFWSGMGLIIMTNSIIIQTVIVLGIIIFCLSFFLATYEVRSRQVDQDNAQENSVVTRSDYFDLVDFTGELSSFIGESVLIYLMVHGLETPLAVPNLFSGSFVVFLSIIMNNGIIACGLLTASIATLWMKWIWDDLVGQETRQQRPTGSARLRALANEMLFRKSGIGIPGLLVINFPIMFTYLATLGALYVAVYEVRKEEDKE